MEKTIQTLNLSDDFLFAKVMADSEICRRILEKILKISIKEVSVPSTQRTIELLFEGKGVRLDVYVNDDLGTVYNIEMQCSKKRNLPKRARYYAGSIDLDLIAAGEDYTKLKKSFVIFICTFDPFQDKRHIYSFENRCLENLTLTLGDETAKIFLNTRGELEDLDEEMLEFLAYIEDTTDRFAEQAKSPLIRQIHQRVTQIRQSREMEVEYMTLMQRDRENIEQGREEGREEGLKEGRKEGRKEGIQMTLDIIRLHLSGKSSREIADVLNLTPSYVDQILQDYESLPG